MTTRRHGFTLVEVLVALVVLSVLAAMGWRAVDAMARSREVAQAASERTLRLSALIGQWEQDLQAVYASATVPGLAFDGAALRLTRRSDGGVQVVVWSLREGVWRRWASPTFTGAAALQQAWLQSQQLQANDPQQLELLRGASDWQLYYFRDSGWSNAQSSGDLVAVASASASGAGATTRQLLPGGVRLVLQLPEGVLTRDVIMAPNWP